jgi:hypothetical protein
LVIAVAFDLAGVLVGGGGGPIMAMSAVGFEWQISSSLCVAQPTFEATLAADRIGYEIV